MKADTSLNRDIKTLRLILHEILGAGLITLEYHLNKSLERGVYQTFFKDPAEFYRALRSFLGAGADAILRILGKKLKERGLLQDLTLEEFLDSFRKCD